jgi:CBS domain-containing protein
VTNERDGDDPDPDSCPPRVEQAMGPAVTVRQDASLQEVAERMLEHGVPAVVVVDERGEVRGALAERQLTLNSRYLRLAGVKVPRIRGQWVSPLEEVEAAWLAARTVSAGELMDTRLTYATVGEPVGVVVERMLRHGADYAVVRAGMSVVGVLSGHDLLWRVAGRVPAEHPVGAAKQAAHCGIRGAQSGVAKWLTGAWR